MGIINVTPDSFSGDGIAPAGRSEAEIVAAALDQAREFVAAGAQILDVGGESSRPAQFYGEHPALSAEDEAALAVPVVAALARAFGGSALVSIDTSKGSVAREALAAGATIVNDVWAGRRDPDTLAAAAEAGRPPGADAQQGGGRIPRRRSSRRWSAGSPAPSTTRWRRAIGGIG